MGKAGFSVHALAGFLKRLVVKENMRLARTWRERLQTLGQQAGPWAVLALAGEQGPRISGLLMRLPCFERLPFFSLPRFIAEPSGPRARLVLGKPGRLLRLFNLYRPHVLCVEVFTHEAGVSVRMFLSDPRPVGGKDNQQGEEHE